MSQLTLDVRVETLPAIPLACIPHTGPYAGDTALFGRLFGQLFGWAGPNGALGPDTQTLTLYYNDPGGTPPEELRMAVAITIPADFEVGDGVEKEIFAGGLYAIANFELDAAQYGDAWELFVGDWLPESGYEMDQRPTFERYLNDPAQHPEGKHLVEMCLPLRAK